MAALPRGRSPRLGFRQRDDIDDVDDPSPQAARFPSTFRVRAGDPDSVCTLRPSVRGSSMSSRCCEFSLFFLFAFCYNPPHPRDTPSRTPENPATK
jgi:hypothetical protein